MGTARPGDIERELKRQGVIIVEKYGKRLATTEALQEEEARLAAFALDGRGTVPRVGVAEGLTRKLATGETLSDGQWEAARGLLESENRVNMVLGPAGAGKSKLLRKFDEGAKLAGKRVTYLGTTSTAVKVLRQDGFEDAQTVAAFLLGDKMQEAARGGRVVIDETSILDHADATRLFDVAKKNDLKLIFVGDPMQHGSIGRGSLHSADDRAWPRQAVPPDGDLAAEETRNTGRRRNCSPRARPAEGFDALDRLRWVTEIGHGEDRYRHMAADYVQALHDGLAWDDVLVVAPTHREAGYITQEIRSQLRGGRKARRRGTRIHPPGAGRGVGGRAGAACDVPRRRRPPVPPECQGRLCQGPADRRHRSGQRCRSSRRHDFRSTGRRKFHWRRGT